MLILWHGDFLVNHPITMFITNPNAVDPDGRFGTLVAATGAGVCISGVCVLGAATVAMAVHPEGIQLIPIIVMRLFE